MGNVPGRSKGCFTCRRRRVKCDATKPLCQRCAKGKFTCEGYPHSLQIVFDRSVGQARQHFEHRLSKPKAHVSSPKVPEAAASLPQDALAIESGQTIRNSQSPIFQQPSMLPFRPEICSIFLVKNFLSQIGSGIKSLLNAWHQFSPTTVVAVHALATSYYGRMHHDQDLVQHASTWYGKALTGLSRDLAEAESAYSTSVLLTTITLTMYEMMNPTQKTAWIQHAGGVGRLIEARGPLRHQRVQDLQLLEATRPLIAGKALVTGTQTFLQEPEWLTIPWALNPSAKSSLQHLLDIFCGLPGLFLARKSIIITKLAFKASQQDLYPLFQPCHGYNELSADLHHRSTTDGLYRIPKYRSLVAALSCRITMAKIPPDHEYFTKSFDLEAKIHTLMAALRLWKYQWYDDQTQYPTTLDDPIPNYPTHLFGPALNFPNIYQAIQFVHYNVTFYTLSALLYELSHGILSPNLAYFTPQPHRIPQPYDESENSELIKQCRHAAIEICRAVPYHLSFERHGSGGAYLMMFPLLTASQPFAPPVRKNVTEAGRWIVGILKKIETDWGMGSGNRWVIAEGD